MESLKNSFFMSQRLLGFGGFVSPIIRFINQCTH